MTARVREILRPGDQSYWCAEAGHEWQIIGYGPTPAAAIHAARQDAARQAIAWRRGGLVSRRIASQYVALGQLLKGGM